MVAGPLKFVTINIIPPCIRWSKRWLIFSF